MARFWFGPLFIAAVASNAARNDSIAQHLSSQISGPRTVRGSVGGGWWRSAQPVIQEHYRRQPFNATF